MTDNPGGKYRNYDYGYIPKDEKIPEGWVRTLRPCMECNSSVTYIDKDKTWHCLKCGWSCSVDGVTVSGNCVNKAVLDGKDIVDADCSAVANITADSGKNKENRMAKGYTEKEMSIIRNGLETGKKITQIADEIGRDPSALSQKIKTMREQGKLPEVKRRKKGVLTAVGTIPPVDFPEFTAEYVKDLQGKLKDANNRIKDMEARVQDANELAYQFEEQVLDLQTQLKSQQDYIRGLEEVAASVIPKKKMSFTERLCNALQKAEEAGMMLEKMEISYDTFAYLRFVLRLRDETSETQETQS